MPFETIEGRPITGTDAWNVGLIVNHARNNIVRSEFSAWDVAVVDEQTGSTIYSRSEASNADISGIFLFFDTLQTDDYWGKNDKGYNFRHQMRQTELTAASTSLAGGRTYLFTYTFTTTDYGDLKQQFRWIMKPE